MSSLWKRPTPDVSRTPVELATNHGPVWLGSRQVVIAAYFNRYKAHEPGKFSKVRGWGSAAEGLEYVRVTHAFFREPRPWQRRVPVVPVDLTVVPPIEVRPVVLAAEGQNR